ncbi:MAG: polysaccharide deacetylase family protein, partial [bacterium]|nr:polysaccharide deacetylase family protein [bacterium]
ANINANVNVDSSVAAAFDISSCDRVYSRGSAGEKEVTLTFNVGTTKEGDIDKLLIALKDSGTTADFFARGDVAEENSGLIKKISEAGFPVYNLSYDHPRFNGLSESGMIEQLAEAESLISQITGKSTKPFFRPPYGEADDTVVNAVTAAGYCPVTWTVDALDWSTDYTAEASKERVISNVSNGAIILMQAANSTTATIVPQIITELKESGYTFVNLSNLL